jgi:tetratricopeptide (TPR) repeat protein
MSAPRSLAGEVITFVGRLSTLSRRQAEELVNRLGGRAEPAPGARTTWLVIGADADGPARSSVEAMKAQAPLAEVVPEDEFCRRAGRVGPAELRQQYYSLRTIRGLYPSIEDRHLRYLEKWGVLRSVVRTPGETYYGFADVAAIRQAASELQQRAGFKAVLRSLAAARDGQLALDFQVPQSASEAGATVVSLASRDARARPAAASRPDTGEPLTAAEELFVLATRWDSGDEIDVEAAMKAYREALALDPLLVPAMINLGNLHYALDQLAEAQALYVHAAVVHPDGFEAHFNLGNIHHDFGRYELAVVCYEQAIELNPAYPEAHFYLAVALEKLGRSADARVHWLEYRRLAPNGEWSELAREFSD